MMPAISAIHHVTLTVRDLDISKNWYTEMLGFSVVKSVSGKETSKAMIHRDDVTLILAQHHSKPVTNEFSEFQAGLDHIGFEVSNSEELEQWRSHLVEHHVIHSNIVHTPIAHVLSFRDPDYIALEFYCVRSSSNV